MKDYVVSKYSSEQTHTALNIKVLQSGCEDEFTTFLTRRCNKSANLFASLNFLSVLFSPL